MYPQTHPKDRAELVAHTHLTDGCDEFAKVWLAIIVIRTTLQLDKPVWVKLFFLCLSGISSHQQRCCQ